MGADPPILMGGDPHTLFFPPVEADPCERSRACARPQWESAQAQVSASAITGLAGRKENGLILLIYDVYKVKVHAPSWPRATPRA